MKLLIILLTFTLSGCQAFSKVMDVAGSVNDEALMSAEATICRAASVGSVIRRYNTPEKAKAWKDLCTDSSNAIPIIFEQEL